MITGEDHAHGMPLATAARPFVVTPLTTGALTYHGGPVVTTATTYAIFWTPSTLQDHTTPGSLPTIYEDIQANLLYEYPGHGIDNNNTQYYMTTVSGVLTTTSWVQNGPAGAFTYTDTAAYPSGGCSYTASGTVKAGNCITDAQIQAEVKKVMTTNGWTGGLNHIFFIYTAAGEGSYLPGTGEAYVNYCGYHGYFLNGSTPVLYANIPYAAPTYCQSASATSPNGNAAGDAAASVTSHELSEAITDPELNAWWDSANGQEIGDLCAWTYGTNTWGSGSSAANQY
jgi:hypothetical protein